MLYSVDLLIEKLEEFVSTADMGALTYSELNVIIAESVIDESGE